MSFILKIALKSKSKAGKNSVIFIFYYNFFIFYLNSKFRENLSNLI
jgi:hypothetical protein